MVCLPLAAVPQAAQADPPATTLGTLTAIAGQRTLSLGFTLRPGQAQQLTDVQVLRRAPRAMRTLSRTRWVGLDDLTAVVHRLVDRRRAHGPTAITL